jgi:cobalt-zinc-cadmium efflux system protein
MGQEHNHSHSSNKKTLTISLVIITAYMAVEVIGGLITNSLALLADAGHMLSDAISLFIALMAFKFSSKVADYGKTYGYKRFEILAAIINGATLILISVYIIYEAIERFQNPPEIQSYGMLIIAFINSLGAFLAPNPIVISVSGNVNCALKLSPVTCPVKLFILLPVGIDTFLS